MYPESRRSITVVALIMLFSGLALAQRAQGAQEPPLKSITYHLSMSRPVSHLFEVQIIVELPEELKDKPLQFQMPKWSPGDRKSTRLNSSHGYISYAVFC